MTQLIIVGYGGHAKVIEECALSSESHEIIGYIDNTNHNSHLKYLGSDSEIEEILIKYPNAQFIIGIGDIQLRRKLIDFYTMHHVKFTSVIHKTAVVSKNATIGEGTVLFPLTVVNPSSVVGKHCILNSGAIIEHDNILGENVHIGPRAVTGGQVIIGHDTLIGIGACVRNNTGVGKHVIVGAGSTVVKDIPDNTLAYGVPARQRGK